MVMPHPLLPVGLPPAGVAMAMNQMSQLSGLANMAAMSHVQEDESKVRCFPTINSILKYRGNIELESERWSPDTLIIIS